MIFGVDTARVAGNRNVSWTRAKAEGPISFAILRSNYGTKPDTFFAQEWKRVQDAGLVRGAYLFLRFPSKKQRKVSEPVEQASAMIDTIGDHVEPRRDLPPTIDVEFPGGAAETGLSVSQILDGVRAAWTLLKEHFRATPIVYTSARVWRDDLKNAPAPDLLEAPLWLARYPFRKGPAVRDPARVSRVDPPVPAPWGDRDNWFIHQYQGDATGLPGFSTGNVDMNRFHSASRGDTGGNVRWIRRRLGLPPDGSFNDKTEVAVKAFQRDHGLTEDGVVGPKTFAALCWE